MKTEIKTEDRNEQTSQQSPPETSPKARASETDTRPTVTCECAFWGPPSPHYLWSETTADPKLPNES